MKTSPDSRRDGIRHARRASNWVAALLLALTGGAAAALAHQASQPSAPHNGVAAGPGPRLSHPVAATTPSGVTVTKTTHVPGGRTVVTQVRSGHGDN